MKIKDTDPNLSFYKRKMIILTSEQVNYCNLIKQAHNLKKNLPGISYREKLYVKDAYFPLKDKATALEFCRNKFLTTKEKFAYLIVEDSLGYTIWRKEDNVKISSKILIHDIVEDIDVDRLVSKMRNVGGIAIKNRTHSFKKYPKTFVGSEAVDWFQEILELSIDEAIRLGQKLIDKKIIHHVVDQHQFENEFLFYRFYWDEN